MVSTVSSLTSCVFQDFIRGRVAGKLSELFRTFPALSLGDGVIVGLRFYMLQVMALSMVGARREDDSGAGHRFVCADLETSGSVPLTGRQLALKVCFAAAQE